MSTTEILTVALNDVRITRYMTGNIGVKVGAVSVLLEGGTEHERRQLAAELLERGAAIAEKETVLEELEKRLQAERKAHIETRMKVPPASPRRLFGAGIIRIDRDGYPWLMNKLEPGEGWGTVGIRFDDWDDLFRHVNARIVAGFVDEHGPFFRFEVKPVEEVKP